MIDKKFSLHIAPMLDVSYREFRYFMRLLTRKAVLWTEMIVDETLAHCPDPDWHLSFDELEHPIVCQIGGNNPEHAKLATLLVERHGYDFIDLNCECPSTRVASNREFGAALMKKPHVAEKMIQSICNTASIPVSVKMRIAVDDFDTLDYIVQFIKRLQPWCRRYIIHARKVYTQGLNPDQNRRIPPLNYHVVYKLCDLFPECDFWINGGINSLQEAKQLCFGNPSTSCDCPELTDESKIATGCTVPPIHPPPNLRGVMMGRAARDNPCLFWDVDRYLFGHANPCRNRRQLLYSYCEYIEKSYPRRCCDDDPRVSYVYPPPKVAHTKNYCRVCQSVYGRRISGERLITVDSKELLLDASCQRQPALKITSNVVDRALKPIWGVFFNMPGSRAFRAACFQLSRDLQVRNCGPGFILRSVLLRTPDDLLDQEFEFTSDA